MTGAERLLCPREAGFIPAAWLDNARRGAEVSNSTAAERLLCPCEAGFIPAAWLDNARRGAEVSNSTGAEVSN